MVRRSAAPIRVRVRFRFGIGFRLRVSVSVRDRIGFTLRGVRVKTLPRDRDRGIRRASVEQSHGVAKLAALPAFETVRGGVPVRIGVRVGVPGFEPRFQDA